MPLRPHRRAAALVTDVLVLVAAAVVAMTLVSAVGTSADAATAAPDEGGAVTNAEQALATRFAPVMMLVVQEHRCGPGEPYRPSDVDVLLGNDDVALRGPWTSRDLIEVAPDAEELARGLRGYELDLPGDPLDPGCSYETWARQQWGSSAEPTIYAHVATQRGVPDRLALQFAFYYPFNDYNNKHESDWERIQLEFDTSDPEAALTMTPDHVVYAQHYGGESATWGDDKLEVVDGSHPVVYVSAGSHASQFAEGLFLGNSSSTGFGCDTTLGPLEAVHPVVRTIPSDPVEAKAAYPWIAYEGHWGQKGPRNFYTGPTGPNMKLFWKKPFTWSEGARDHSFPVPGAGAAGTSATGFFCSAVARGSKAFRHYVSDPVPALLLLAALLAALIWALRQTTWRSASTSWTTRRTPGQVVGAAWGWWRRHRRASLLLATGSSLPLLAAGALQVLSTVTPVPVAPRVVVTALGWLALLLTTGAVVHAVSLGDGRISVGASYRAALDRLPRTLATVALAALPAVVFASTVVLLPLTVVLLGCWSLLVPVVQVEGLWGVRALLRSGRLALRTLTTIVPLVGVWLLVVLILGLLLASGAFVVFTAPFSVMSAIPTVVTAVTWPFTSLLLAYAYGSAVSPPSVDEPTSRPGDEVSAAAAQK